MVRPVGETVWRRLDRAAATLELNEPALRALSPIVVIAPHPDDETLGCGGLLAAASRLGLQPRVIYLTDGGASHVGSAAWPRARLVEARRAEALAALSHLGVGAAATLFLDWPDAKPHPRGSADYLASLERVTAWAGETAPRGLLAPWQAEAHCDHRAASDLADDLAERFGARRLDYLVWGWTLPEVESAHAHDRCWRLPCARDSAARRAALNEHRTQTTDLITDADEAFLIPPDLAALTGRSSELFFERAPNA